MAKLLLVGDPHLSAVQPRNRLDNYQETSLKKLSEISSIASRYNVDACIFGGDMFHIPIRDRAYMIEVIKTFFGFTVPCYTIVGNHQGDIKGTDFPTWETSSLGLLVSTRAVSFLDYETIKGFHIKGMSAYQSMPPTEYDSEVEMLVCHMFVGQGFGDTLCVYPQQLKQRYPNLKYLFAGHDHAEYPVSVSNNGIVVIRPGSMMRVASDEASKRIPKVALLDTDMETVEYISLSCSRPYDEVFSVKRKEERKASKSISQSFLSSLSSVSSRNNDIDIQTIINEKLSHVNNPHHVQIITDDLRQSGFIV